MPSTSMPMLWKVRAAMSRPEPWPLTSMSTRRTPWSIALFATLSAVIWAAYGVLLRLPLKPKAPADSQAMTLPSWSVTLTIVLLNELFMCTMPDAPVRAYIYEPPDVLIRLAPKIALDLNVLVYVGSDLGDLALGQIADLRVRVHAGLVEDFFGRRASDAVHVCKPNLYPLLAWQVHTRYARHTSSPASACAAGSRRLPAKLHACVLPCTYHRQV